MTELLSGAGVSTWRCASPAALVLYIVRCAASGEPDTATNTPFSIVFIDGGVIGLQDASNTKLRPYFCRAPAPDCPPGYYRYQIGYEAPQCVKYLDSGVDFATSQELCELDTPGAKLATWTTREEFELIYGMCHQFDVSNADSNRLCWLGGKSNNGTWEFIGDRGNNQFLNDSSSLSVWSPEGPDGKDLGTQFAYGGVDCLSTAGGGWTPLLAVQDATCNCTAALAANNPAGCSASAGYATICQIPADTSANKLGPSTWMCPGGTVDIGTRCLSIVDVPEASTWEDAREQCMTLPGLDGSSSQLQRLAVLAGGEVGFVKAATGPDVAFIGAVRNLATGKMQWAGEAPNAQAALDPASPAGWDLQGEQQHNCMAVNQSMAWSVPCDADPQVSLPENATKAVCTVPKPAEACPGGWTRSLYSPRCFMVTQGDVLYSDAAAACTSYSDTAYPATFESEQELRYFVDQAHNVESDYWIGAHFNDSQSTYTWVNRFGDAYPVDDPALLDAGMPYWASAPTSSVLYAVAWQDNEPTTTANPAGGRLITKDGATEKHPVMCASGLPSVMVDSPCPEGFQVSPTSDRCYAVAPGTAVIGKKAAQRQCNLLHPEANLASAGSTPERNWLLGYFSRHPALETEDGLLAWHLDDPVEGRWAQQQAVNVDPQLTSLTQDVWDAGEPSSPALRCAAVRGGTGRAVAVDCDTVSAVPICVLGVEGLNTQELEVTPVAAVAPLHEQLATDCPGGWVRVPSSGICLRPFSSGDTSHELVTFAGAVSACGGAYPGAALWWGPQSDAELADIATTLASFGAARYWTSAQVPDPSGSPVLLGWRQPTDPTALAPGALGGKQCVQVGASGFLSDAACEVPSGVPLCAFTPGCPAGMTRHPKTEHCWKVSTAAAEGWPEVRHSWESAAAACSIDGGELAELQLQASSEPEQGAIWLQSLPIPDEPAINVGGVYMGARFSTATSRWEWVTSREEVHASAWQGGAAPVDTSAGSCVALNRDSRKLVPVPCSVQPALASNSTGFQFACTQAPHGGCSNIPGAVASPISGSCYILQTTSTTDRDAADAACAALDHSDGLATVWHIGDARWLAARYQAQVPSGPGMWVDARRVAGSAAVSWAQEALSPGGLGNGSWVRQLGVGSQVALGTASCYTLGDASVNQPFVVGQRKAHVKDQMCAQPAHALCAVTSPCPDSSWVYSPHTHTCLKRSASAANAVEALTNCQSLSSGPSQLWMPRDPREMLFVARDLFRDQSLWLGAKLSSFVRGFVRYDNRDASALLMDTTLPRTDPTRLRAGSLFGFCSAGCSHPELSYSKRYLQWDFGQYLATNEPIVAHARDDSTAYVCELIPPCPGADALGPSDRIAISRPGAVCAVSAPKTASHVSLKAWGAAGSPWRSKQGQGMSGGAGGHAAGILQLTDVLYNGSLIIEVAGGRMQYWAGLAGETPTTITAGSSGGSRSSVMHWLSGQLNFENELVVAAGGGGGGTHAEGGAGGSYEGGTPLLPATESNNWFAYSGVGGSHPRSPAAQHGNGGGGWALDVSRTGKIASTDACLWGTSGSRNVGGTGGCSPSEAVPVSVPTGGGGYMGGGAGAAISASTASAAGGGAGFISGTLTSSRLVGGKGSLAALVADPERPAAAGTADSLSSLRGGVVLQFFEFAPRCEPAARAVLSAPGMHVLNSPVGALSADVAMWGAGAGPSVKFACAGGAGGFAFARLRVTPGTPFTVEVGETYQKYASAQTVYHTAAASPFGTRSLIGNGTNGFGIGLPNAPMLAGGYTANDNENRGSGGRSAIWSEGPTSEWMVAGGGGGGGGGSSLGCSFGGGGGGVDAGDANSAGDAAGGNGASAGFTGIAGLADGDISFAQAAGEDGLRQFGGRPVGSRCEAGVCQVHAADGGDGYYGGASGTANMAEVAGGGGGSGFYLTDVVLDASSSPPHPVTGRLHPDPFLETAQETSWYESEDPVLESFRAAARAAEPESPGIVTVTFRCTSCPEADDCAILDANGDRQCYERLAERPKDNPADVHSQCYVCDPSGNGGYMTWSYRGVGTGCDDGLLCTFNDNCTTSGLCQGTPYSHCLNIDFTEDPAQNCEVCDGTAGDGSGGCALKDGFLGGVVDTAEGKSCACNISGVLYAHNAPNPMQPQCQLCDVTKDPTEWSFRPPGLACNDTDLCTFDDSCDAGFCVGVPYSCEEQSCHRESECDGTGGCTNVLYTYANAVTCSPALTQCNLDVTCDGTIATCPGYGPSQPVTSSFATPGTVALLQPYSQSDSGITAMEELNPQNPAVASSTDLVVQLTDFDIACDVLSLRLGVKAITSSAQEAVCRGSQIDVVAADESAVPVVRCPAGFELVSNVNSTQSTCIKVQASAQDAAAASATCAASTPHAHLLTSVFDPIVLQAAHGLCATAGSQCWTGVSKDAGGFLVLDGPADVTRTASLLDPVNALWGSFDHAAAPVNMHARLSAPVADSTAVQLELDAPALELPALCEAPPVLCPPGFSPLPSDTLGSVCVKLDTTLQTAADAESACASAGGSLLSVTTRDAQLQSMLSKLCPGECWTGAEYTSASQSWIWQSGAGTVTAQAGSAAPLGTVPWASSEPSGTGVRQGYWDGTAEGLKAAAATETKASLCQAPTLACGSASLLVESDPGRLICLQPAAAGSQSDAQITCAGLGGVLATPTSDSLLEAASTATGITSSGWVSLVSDKVRGAHVAPATGYVLPSSGSDAWLPWAASNPSGALACTAVDFSANPPKLVSAACSESKAAVCELPPLTCPSGHYVKMTAGTGPQGQPGYQCIDASDDTTTATALTAASGLAAGRSMWLLNDQVLQFKRADSILARDVITMGYTALQPEFPRILRLPNIAPLAHSRVYQVLAEIVTVNGEKVAACSESFVVDTTPPFTLTTAAVNEVDPTTFVFGDESPAADITFVNSDPLSFTWHGFVDAESSNLGLLTYQFCVTQDSPSYSTCTVSPPGSDGALTNVGAPIDRWTDTTASGYHLHTNLGMVQGKTYYVHIKAFNSAGLFTILSSNGVLFDNSDPVGAAVADGSSSQTIPEWQGGAAGGASTDAAFTKAPSTFTVHWDEFVDAESQVVEYIVGSGTIPGRLVDNTATFVSTAATDRTVVLTAASAPPTGTTVYTMVTAVNAAGGRTTRTTTGITVDTAAPILAAYLLPALGSDADVFKYAVPDVAPGDFDADSTPVLASPAQDALRLRVSLQDTTAGFGQCQVAVGVSGTLESIQTFTPLTVCVGGDTPSLGSLDLKAPFCSGTLAPTLPAGDAMLVTVKCTDRAQNDVTAAVQVPLVVEPDAPDVSAAQVLDVDPIYSPVDDTDIASTSDLRADWSGWNAGFADMTSYSIAVTTNVPPGGADLSAVVNNVLDWTHVGAVTSVVLDDLSVPLVQDTTHYILVRGFSTNGKFADKASDGFLFSNEPVSADGVGVAHVVPSGRTNATATSTASQLQFVWNAFELGGPVLAQQYSVRRCTVDIADAPDVVPWTDTEQINTTSATITGLQLQQGVVYCVALRAFGVDPSDPAVVEAAPLVVDLTPPHTAPVFNTLGLYSEQFSTDSHRLNASFEIGTAVSVTSDDVVRSDRFYDLESGIDTWLCCAGTATGVCDLAPMAEIDVDPAESLGTCQFYLATPLTQGLTCYVTVAAENAAGLRAQSSSDGLTIDLTGSQPEHSAVNTTVTANTPFATLSLQTATLSVVWSPWQNQDAPAPGISAAQFTYSWAAGTAPGDGSLVPLTAVGTKTSASAAVPGAEDGEQYVVTVVVFDVDGRPAGQLFANVTLDLGAPAAAENATIANAHKHENTLYVASSGDFAVSWDTVAASAERGATYSVAVGTSPYGQQVLPYSAHSAIEGGSMNVTGAHLVPGMTYFVSVMASAPNGLTKSSSWKLKSDLSAPRNGGVWTGASGAAAQAKYITALNQVSCHWEAAQDNQSPVLQYTVQLFQIPTGSGAPVPASAAVLVPSTGTAQKHDFVSGSADMAADLTDHSTLQCVVASENAAGLRAAGGSSIARVVASGPTGGTVLDGPQYMEDATWTANCSVATASWHNFNDIAGIASYAFALGSTPGDTDIMGFKPTGRSRQGKAFVSLPAETVVFVTVKAVNHAGFASMQTSDGFRCSDSVPDINSNFTVAKAALSMMAVADPAARTQCICMDPNSVFVPDFAAGGASCRCQGGFRWAPLAGECQACSPGDCLVGPVVPLAPAATDVAPARQCSPGLYFNEDSASCAACPLGTFKASSRDLITECIPCSPPAAQIGTEFVAELDTSATGGDAIVQAVLTSGSTFRGAQLADPLAVDLSGGNAQTFVSLPSVLVSGQAAFVTLTLASATGFTSSRTVSTGTVSAAPPAVRSVWNIPHARRSNDSEALSDTADTASTSDARNFASAWQVSPQAAADGYTVQFIFGSAPGLDDVLASNQVTIEAESTNAELGSCHGIAASDLPDGSKVYATLTFSSLGNGASMAVATNGIEVDSSPPQVRWIAVGDGCYGVNRSSVAPVSTLWVADSRSLPVCWAWSDGMPHRTAALAYSLSLVSATSGATVAGPMQVQSAEMALLSSGSRGEGTLPAAVSASPLYRALRLSRRSDLQLLVTATDAAGTVANATSAVMHLDQTASLAANVSMVPLAAAGDSCCFQANTSAVQVQWEAHAQEEVRAVTVALGSVQYAMDLAPPVAVSAEQLAALAGDVIIPSLSLHHGSNVYATVFVETATGTTAFVSGQPLVVDAPWSVPVVKTLTASLQGSSAAADAALPNTWSGTVLAPSGTVQELARFARVFTGVASDVVPAAVFPFLSSLHALGSRALVATAFASSQRQALGMTMPLPFDMTSGIASASWVAVPLDAGADPTSFNWTALRPSALQSADGVLRFTVPLDAVPTGKSVVTLRATNGAGVSSVAFSQLLTMGASAVQHVQVAVPSAKLSATAPARAVQALYAPLDIALEIPASSLVPLTSLTWQVHVVGADGVEVLAGSGTETPGVYAHTDDSRSAAVLLQDVDLIDTVAIAGSRLRVTATLTDALGSTGSAVSQLVALDDEAPTAGVLLVRRSGGELASAVTQSNTSPGAFVSGGSNVRPAALSATELESVPYQPLAGLMASGVQLVLQGWSDSMSGVVSACARVSMSPSGWHDVWNSSSAQLAGARACVNSSHLTAEGLAAGVELQVPLTHAVLQEGDMLWATVVVTDAVGIASVSVAPVARVTTSAPAAAGAAWLQLGNACGQTLTSSQSVSDVVIEPVGGVNDTVPDDLPEVLRIEASVTLPASVAAARLHAEYRPATDDVITLAWAGATSEAAAITSVDFVLLTAVNASALTALSQAAQGAAGDGVPSTLAERWSAIWSASGVVSDEVAFVGVDATREIRQATGTASAWSAASGTEGRVQLLPAPARSVAASQRFMQAGEVGAVLLRFTTAAGDVGYLQTAVTVTDGSAPEWATAVAGAITAPAVFDGSASGVDADCIVAPETFTFGWTPPTEVDSPITQYEWCIGSQAGLSDKHACVTVSASTLTADVAVGEGGSEGSISWMSDEDIYVVVRATNAAGLESEAVSDGVRALCDPEADSSCMDGGRRVVCIAA